MATWLEYAGIYVSEQPFFLKSFQSNRRVKQFEDATFLSWGTIKVQLKSMCQGHKVFIFFIMICIHPIASNQVACWNTELAPKTSKTNQNMQYQNHFVYIHP